MVVFNKTLNSQAELVKAKIEELMGESQVAKPQTQLSSADEIAKYKSLLDSGAITQDEYDAKKKQLLGI